MDRRKFFKSIIAGATIAPALPPIEPIKFTEQMTPFGPVKVPAKVVVIKGQPYYFTSITWEENSHETPRKK